MSRPLYPAQPCADRRFGLRRFIAAFIAAFALALLPAPLPGDEQPDTPDTATAPSPPPRIAPPDIDAPVEYVPATRSAAADQDYHTVRSPSLLAAEHAIAQVIRKAIPDELGTYFPIGREFKGVVVPSYEDDMLKSIMTASVVKRIDEQILELTDLVVTLPSEDDPGQSGSQDPDSETTIHMDEAEYDLVAGELTSRTPATVTREEFVLTGDQMIFDTQTQFTRVIGDVRMVIHDAPEFGPDSHSPAQ